MEVRRNTNWCSAFEYPFIVTENGITLDRFGYESQAFAYVAMHEAMVTHENQEVENIPDEIDGLYK